MSNNFLLVVLLPNNLLAVTSDSLCSGFGANKLGVGSEPALAPNPGLSTFTIELHFFIRPNGGPTGSDSIFFSNSFYFCVLAIGANRLGTVDTYRFSGIGALIGLSGT